MLREFLRPGSGDRVIDLGCGSGRALLWNRDLGADAIGIDISPFFSEDARREMPLLLGDLRRLPFADGTFTKAWSLDVLEHLSPEALRGMLTEANRVLAPGGSLFVYTHVRKNAPIAVGLRWINRAARGLERLGLIDMRQERLRKSDHLNPLADVPDLERVVARVRVPHRPHHVLHADRRRVRREHPHADGRARDGEARRPARSDRRAPTRTPGRSARPDPRPRRGSQAAPRPMPHCASLSFAMKLDLLLFGRVTSGPFFALLVKDETANREPRAASPT